MTEELRLYTFAVSHFSEKIRWSLDASSIPYREIAWTPAFHMSRAFFKTGRATTVPILETGKEVIQDSTRILEWLERNRSPFALLPSAPDERRAVLEIEERFDEVGKHVIRYAYGTALDHPRAVQTMWLAKSNAFERRLLPALFPLIAPVFRKKFRVNPAAVARSEEVIAGGIAWLDERVADGRRYLFGDRLTAADLTAAALLAPLVCPAEHPLYSEDSYREVMAPAVQKWDARPSFRWVRDLYRTDRRRLA